MRRIPNPLAPESREIPKNPEIPSYTFEELQDLNLPGYQRPASALEVLSPESDWTPVLSGSEFVVRGTYFATRALTAVRLQHPHMDVVSTPTMQMVKNYRWLQTLVTYRQEYMIDQDPCELPKEAPMTNELGTVASFRPRPEPLDTRGGTLSYYVDRMHRYKLGLPSIDEAIDQNIILGTTSLCSLNVGFSQVNKHEDGAKPRYEALSLFASANRLHPGVAAMIGLGDNEKYRYMGWTDDSRTFAEDVEKQDTTRLAPSAGAIAVWFCAFGKCLQLTSDVASRPDLAGHLAIEEWAKFFWEDRPSWHVSA